MDAVYYHAVSNIIETYYAQSHCLSLPAIQPKNFELRRVPIPQFGDEDVLFKGGWTC